MTENVSEPGMPAGMIVSVGPVTALSPWGLRLTIGFTLTTPGATPPGTDRPAVGIEAVHALGPTASVPERGVIVMCIKGVA